MSRKYERKTLRASWTAEDLEEAMRSVLDKTMGVNQAANHYKIPSRTLRRHLITGRSKVPLGRNPVFSMEHEKKLVGHIKKLEKVGFAPDRKDVKEMAFQLARKLDIKNPFSKESESAGNVWFSGFMTRNSELSQRKSEGLSLSRAYGVNRKDVEDFFNLLATIYEENDFANHPEDIFNMDESGIQVNNKPGKVIATKGAKEVYTLTSCEKGENVTVIACCNAAGNFIPPVLIYKGTYSKPQFSEGLPPGSQIFMNKKSSYINTELFMKWFEEVFLRHKSSRTTLLLLDGHSSHSNNIRLLEVAQENNVILLCFPSHTTHALQPLDRAFFRPLKVYFAQEAKAWMVNNKDKKLTRYDVSKLIGKAWGKAATVSNGVSALKSCGIYPFNPNAIPDHYFSLSDALQEQNLVEDDQSTRSGSPSLMHGLDENSSNVNAIKETVMIHSPLHDYDLEPPISVQNDTDALIESVALNTQTPIQLGFSKNKTTEAIDVDMDQILPYHMVSNTPQKNPQLVESEPGCSGVTKSKHINIIPNTPEKTPIEPKDTPTKILSVIYPVPKLPLVLSKRKQTAVVLTSPENIEKRKMIANRKKPISKIETEKRKQVQKTIKRKVTVGEKKISVEEETKYERKNKKRGWRTLIEDVEFLIGGELHKYWVWGWWLSPAVIAPFTTWWIADIFIRDWNWSDPSWEAVTVLAATAAATLVFVVCACVAVARQVHYDIISKLKASFVPSRHWGPRDPITHYYWLARRDEVDRENPSMTRYNRRELGQLSRRPSFLTVSESIQSKDDQNAPEIKQRSNSDDWVYTLGRRECLAQLCRGVYERKRSKSLDWEVTIKMKSSDIINFSTDQY